MKQALFGFLLLCSSLVAQSTSATIRFTFANARLTPSSFALEVNDQCVTTYFTSSGDDQTLVEQPGNIDADGEDSASSPAPAPVSAASEPSAPKKSRSFPMTPALCQQVFDLARSARYFEGDFQFKKHKVAYTGDRTLEYQSPTTDHKTSYTWSEDPSIQKLTAIFEGVSTTLEAAPQIQHTYRFDRLGLNQALSHLVDMANRGWLQEVWLIEPDLKRIADDPKVMNIARQRAAYLIKKSHNGLSAGTKK